ncbi:MAG: hypothetical protein RIS17_475, partial [Pseudomonadota bacterium]
EAIDQLKSAFPVSAPDLADYRMDEASDWPEGDARAYAGIQSRFIAPIAEAGRLIPLITIAIANHFGAYG